MSARIKIDRKGLHAAIEAMACFTSYDTPVTLAEDCIRAYLAALSTEPGEAEGWRDIPVTDETLDYVSKYGGRCRDCADYFGVCPGGLPCNYEERRAAIRHVLRAINYGMTHGYLPAAPLPEDTHHGR